MQAGYVDFSLAFESAADGGYLVRGASPRAEAESVARFDFDLVELFERLRSRASSGPSGESAGTARDLRRERAAAPTGDLTEIGRKLFAALLPGEVGELYGHAVIGAQAAGMAVRLRLHLRPRNPHLAWLCKVPWELLYDERTGSFPCLDRRSPMVRHLDLPRPVERMRLSLPLKVLVVAASPHRMAALNLQEEQAAMGEAGRVRMQVLDGAGPEEVRQALLRERYQAVHFMGHGLSGAAQGSLIFATRQGLARPVSGAELSQVVQGADLCFTLLNACHSAAVPEGGGAADPLSGVAGALIRGGQAAVAGMQLSILDVSAIAFSRTLYARLGAGDALEAAFAEARLALYLADSQASDWVAPVLFLRGADPRFEERPLRRGQRQEGVPMGRPPIDQVRTVYKSTDIEGDEIVLTGEVLSVPAKGRSVVRPRDSFTGVEARRTKVGKLIVTGSEQRTRSED